MVVSFKIESRKPIINDLSPLLFFMGAFFIATFITLLFGSFAAFSLGMITLVFGMHILIRVSPPKEVILIENGTISAYSGKKKLWSKEVTKIRDVDIDTFSEFKRMKGSTMIVFNLLDGDSWSIKYVNYSHSQLKDLKCYFEKNQVRQSC